ncbi:MAG: hypothetical protein ACLFOY_07945 [Desulfatibacillaceae bacterium]
MGRKAVSLAVLVLVVACAAPAAAFVSFEATGAYRVRGFYNSHPHLLKESSTIYAPNGNVRFPAQQDDSDAWLDMRLRLQARLHVTDFLTMTTRFDALERYWGQQPANEGMEWEYAYMTIHAPFAKFDVGRMSSNAWGTDFVDNEEANDRVKMRIDWRDFSLFGVYQKDAEYDAFSQFEDSDVDSWHLGVGYFGEKIEAAALASVTIDKSYSDRYSLSAAAGAPVAYTVTDFVDAAGRQNDHPYDREEWAVNPYVKAKLGHTRVQGEMSYKFGDYRMYDREKYARYYDPVTNQYYAVNRGFRDVEVRAYAWNLEAGLDLKTIGAELGYAWVGGDDDPNDDEYRSFGGTGEDWEKLWILTGTQQGLENQLGPGETQPDGSVKRGNLAHDPYGYGARIFYLGGYVKPYANMKLSLRYGHAQAEQPPSAYSQDYGSEYNLYFDWYIYDNLSYSVVAAYLDAGDFWQFGDRKVRLENIMAMQHQLRLNF